MTLKKWLTLFLCIIFACSFSTVHAEVGDSIENQVIDASELTIGAEAALLMDAETKTVLYEKNGYTRQYPASITKLMTALLAIENLSPEQTITFSKEAIFSIEPGSNHIGMDVGEQITVDQALHGLLLESANEVANGLGEAVSGSISGFAQLMTDRASQLGALDTHFVNPNGLHDPEHYTTAYDMALIASYLTTNDYFLQIMKDTSYQIPPTNLVDEVRYLAQQHPMINPVRNPSLFREDVIGGKTGYTDQARQTLVTMARRGETTLVAVILKAEKSTVYTDTNELLDFGFNSYTTKTLHTTDEILKTLPMYSVKSGQDYLAANCGISLAEDANLLINRLVDEEDISLSFDLPESLLPSVQSGDLIGTVDFVLNGKSLGTFNLIVSKIDWQPEPEFNALQKLSFLPPMYVALIVILALFMLLLLFFFIRKHHKRRKRIKMRRMFK